MFVPKNGYEQTWPTACGTPHCPAPSLMHCRRDDHTERASHPSLPHLAGSVTEWGTLSDKPEAGYRAETRTIFGPIGMARQIVCTWAHPSSSGVSSCCTTRPIVNDHITVEHTQVSTNIRIMMSLGMCAPNAGQTTDTYILWFSTEWARPYPLMWTQLGLCVLLRRD